MSDVVVAAIIGGLSTLIAAALAVFFVQRLTARADATSKLQTVIAAMGTTYNDLVNNVRETVEIQFEAKYHDRIEDLERRVIALEAESNAYLKGAWQNHDQLVQNGLVPSYKPPKPYQTGPLPAASVKGNLTP
jgi:hypothetical protein